MAKSDVNKASAIGRTTSALRGKFAGRRAEPVVLKGMTEAVEQEAATRRAKPLKAPRGRLDRAAR